MQRLAYSIEECAKMIGCSPRTVVREIQRGRLGVFRVGRLVRITEQSLRIYGAIPNGTKPQRKENGDAGENAPSQP